VTGARTQRGLLIAGLAGTTGAGAISILLAWLALLGGAKAASGCAATDIVTPSSVSLAVLFQAAAGRYGLGDRGPAILAGIADVETHFGRDMSTSSAGAVGFMQFMPDTWATYGVDADGDGRKDPASPGDAIFSAAQYLRASGAPADWPRAIFAYNHSSGYVQKVLEKAGHYAQELPAAAPVAACDASAAELSVTPGISRVTGDRALAAIRGFPSEEVDQRILPDVLALIATYHVAVTAGYATSGHAPDGEHRLGLAVDLVPGPHGTWDDVDRLAAWAEPEQDHPRPPFRWVGYNGDANHGRGNHLHLSWEHSPTEAGQRSVRWVDVFDVAGG
jgi:hypothetical protein